MSCVVPGCVPDLGEVKKIHRFPGEPDRFRSWIQFCGITQVPHNGYICGRHFRDEDYRPSHKILGHPRKLWRLDNKAVPTLKGPDRASTPEIEGDAFPDAVDQQLDTESEDVIIEYVEEEEEEEEEADEVEVGATRKCRLCLNVPDPSVSGVRSLFAKTKDQRAISSLLVQFFQLQFEDTEGWPPIICGTCVKFIGEMEQFKVTIISSHCQLYKEIAAANVVEEHLEDVEESSEEMEKEPTNEDETTEETPMSPSTPIGASKLDKISIERGLLKCHVCAEDAPHLTGLFNHMIAKHREEPPYIFCCEAKHPLRQKALAHLKTHVEHKCTDCNKVFKTCGVLDKHMRSVHAKNPKFVCHICGKATSSNSTLRSHLLTHEPKSKHPFKCSYCDSRFISGPALQRHVNRLHEVEQRFVCEVCGKGYACNGSLWDHMKTHSESARKPTLRRKPKRTTELTPEESEIVKCSECDMYFKRAEMRKHTSTHNKGHYCNICCIRIVGGFRYTSHMDKHTGKVYNCDHCDAVLKTQNAHWYHMRDKHPTIKKSQGRKAK